MNYIMLDKKQHYGIYVIGTGRVSRIIQKVSSELVKSQPQNFQHLEPLNIASHAAMLFYLHDTRKVFIRKTGAYFTFKPGWYVAESHFKTGGVNVYSFYDFLKINKCPEFYLFPDKFNLEKIFEYISKSVPYGSLDIIEHFKHSAFSSLLKMNWSDSYGVICSEFYAEVQSSNALVDSFTLPAHAIKPLHIQQYASENGNIIKGDKLVNNL